MGCAPPSESEAVKSSPTLSPSRFHINCYDNRRLEMAVTRYLFILLLAALSVVAQTGSTSMPTMTLSKPFTNSSTTSKGPGVVTSAVLTTTTLPNGQTSVVSPTSSTPTTVTTAGGRIPSLTTSSNPAVQTGGANSAIGSGWSANAGLCVLFVLAAVFVV